MADKKKIKVKLAVGARRYRVIEVEEDEVEAVRQGENADLTSILDQTELGGAKTRFKNNVVAIRLANFLYDRNATATDAEKKVLSQFVGWGGLAQAFDEKNESWKKEYAELKKLLSAEDYEQARSSNAKRDRRGQQAVRRGA